MSKHSHSNNYQTSENPNILTPSPISHRSHSHSLLEPLEKNEQQSVKEQDFSKSIEDLLTHLEFDVHAGKIWFGGQRMLLNHAHALWRLREELNLTLGSDITQRLFFRYGYFAGVEDAEISKKLRPDGSWKEVFLSGPQLHTIRGMVKVVPDEMTVDFDSGKFFASFDWYNSFEVAYHKKFNGLSETPVCFSSLGYASGYTSYFFGRQIAFKEVQCAAMGFDHCRIEGRPLEEWEEDTDLQKFFNTERLNTELFERRSNFDEVKRQNPNTRIKPEGFFSAIGESPSFKKATALTRKVAKTKATVLLQGETGVGKEVFAQALHEASDRNENPFIAINCASIPTDLVESELFGVEKGAFTGAVQTRQGKIEVASSGTLFLDEVVELSHRAQAALLRVLQEGVLNRVGSHINISVDVRVIVATNEDLQTAVTQGRFRQDLYYRLSTFPIHIPPLRERKQDILLLAKFFLQKYAAMYNKNIQGFTDQAREYLNLHTWPGNVRELQNVTERAVILNEDHHLIDAADLLLSNIQDRHKQNSQKLKISADSGSLQLADDSRVNEALETLFHEGFDLENFNDKLIHAALNQCEGNVSKAARLLNISRAKLDYRLSKSGDNRTP
ncbi:sigma-54-dependent Fis family transcriptional regulator [Psychrobacter sp. P2G3]|uniref:sigma-54-dependent Fis family transcriptional regulator n=1 Tax=Psychrobacter sp. P2G3 TaxID=1699622 RepID=UPI0009EF0048|nr:sigma-54-dependent Fis family transcriptional regulator [Psychrobacter sp. P2G3]